jgi:GNAT superfamily N-acetyltransferase
MTMQPVYVYTVPEQPNVCLASAFLSPDLLTRGRNQYTKESWVLDRLMVYPVQRGKGWGSRMLAHVALEADRAAAELRLGVDPLIGSPLSHLQLRKFYRRYGFVSHRPQTDVNFMRRIPLTTATESSDVGNHIRQQHKGCLLCKQ